MNSEERAWKFWLVVAPGKFASANQKHYPDLESDTSSVWNYCARFSDVISRETRWGRERSAVFSGRFKTFSLLNNICSLNLFASVTVMIVFRKIRLRTVDIAKVAKTVAVLPDLSGCSQIFLASSKKQSNTITHGLTQNSNESGDGGYCSIGQ